MDKLLSKLKEVQKKIIKRRKTIYAPETFLILIFALHTKEYFILADIRKLFEKNKFKTFSKLNSGELEYYLIPLIEDKIIIRKDNKKARFLTDKFKLDNEEFCKTYLFNYSDDSKAFLDYLKENPIQQVSKLIKANNVSIISRLTFYTYLMDIYLQFEKSATIDLTNLKNNLLEMLVLTSKYFTGMNIRRLKDIQFMEDWHKKSYKTSKKSVKLERSIDKDIK